MDCIILVGNRESYREVAEESNKAFLKIKGRYILHIMLDELKDVPEISRLLLVGPKDRLDTFLVEAYNGNYPKPIMTFEQQKDLLENALEPVRKTEDPNNPDRHVLFLPSDVPLITAEEVREFIQLADMNRYDFVTGLVTAKTLSRFAPDQENPGVRMLCFNLSCDSYRPNNMHMVRPNAIHSIDYIRRVYSMRYQKRFINALKLMFEVGTTVLGFRGLTYLAFMRFSLMFRAWGWNRLARLCERRLSRTKGEGGVSEVLSARFKTVVTSSGGSTVDVDNDRDYHTVCQRFEEWKTMLKADANIPVKK